MASPSYVFPRPESEDELEELDGLCVWVCVREVDGDWVVVGAGVSVEPNSPPRKIDSIKPRRRIIPWCDPGVGIVECPLLISVAKVNASTAANNTVVHTLGANMILSGRVKTLSIVSDSTRLLSRPL